MKSKIVREINYNGRKYLSLKHTADLSGYHRDYIGQLIRKGDLSAEKIGFAWFIEETEWNRFLNKKNGTLAENISQSRGSEFKYTEDAWEKELLGKSPSNLEFKIKLPKITLPKIPFPKFSFKQWSLGMASILIATFILWNISAIGSTIIFAKNQIADAVESVNVSAKEKIANLAKTNYFLALSLPQISLPSLPFTLEDSRLAVSDIKNRFLENLFLWKDYLVSFGRDIKIIAQDFLSLKSTEVTETPPPDLLKEGSKIITFGEATSTPPPTPSLLRRVDTTPESPPLQGQGGEGVVSNILIRLASLESKLASPQNLDQKLSSLNQAILAQIQLSLSQLEKRLPSNQVQNPVVFLTTQIPGPQQAGGGSPPQSGSGVSASFGDFSSGISTGGNLSASGNITLGQDIKTAEITSSAWKITSAGAASGFTSLSTNSLSATSLTAGTISGDTTFSGNLAFSNNSTTTISASAINAFSFATSTSVTPFLSFDTKNYRIGLGTTSPGATFSVAGSGFFNSALTVNGLTTLGYASTTGVTASQYFQAGGAGGLNVFSSGLTGIGTTSPSQLLSVQGNGLFSGNLSSADLTATGTVTFSNALAVSSGGTGLSSFTAGDIIYASGQTTLSKVSSSTDGFILSLTNGKPLWVATSTFSANGPLTITSTGSTFSFNASSSPFFGTLTASSTAHINTLKLDNALTIANGGTNATAFTTSGNGVYYDGTSLLTAPLTGSITIPYASTTGISSSQGATFATVSGNVGIGTTNSPITNIGSAKALTLESAAGGYLEVSNKNDSIADGDDIGALRFIAGASTQTLVAQMATQTVGTAENAADLLFYTKTAAGSLTERLRIRDTGNVGIGTASPDTALEVNGAGCFDTAANTHCTAVARTAGDIYYGSAHSNWTDIAEKYPSLELLEPGDIISLDVGAIASATSSKPYVKKAIAGETLIGAISTQPGMVLGDDYGKSPDFSVGISGRVPVKVNLEGGAIKIGDRITSSSVAGVGMKATTSGQTVGIALESYPNANDTNGGANATNTPKILVFVNLGYSKLDSEIAKGESGGWIIDQSTGRVKTSYTLDMDGHDIVNVRKILSASGLWSIDENGKLIVQEIQTGKLTVTGPQGITIYDKKGQAGCLSIEDVASGAISVTPGVCSTPGVAQTLPTSTSTPDITPPVITILGNNPATINVGASYADPGVTVTDNVSQNLGYTASLDGGPALSQGAGLSLDTSTTTTHIILYTAVDSAGNTASATRTVEVVPAP